MKKSLVDFVEKTIKKEAKRTKKTVDNITRALPKRSNTREKDEARSSVSVSRDGKNQERKWRNMYSVLVVAEKMITGDENMNPRRFKTPQANRYMVEGLEPALKKLVTAFDKAMEQELRYQRAAMILKNYYAQDKIYDFTMDLIDIWGQELIEENPILYARELYNNSLINIRRCFGRMQEELQKMKSGIDQESCRTLLEHRLRALEYCHFSDTGLAELARAARNARSICGQVTIEDGMPQDPADYNRFIQQTEKLAALFLDNEYRITVEKLQEFTNAILETVQEEERRIARMQEDIDKAETLYSQLYKVLAEEKAVDLMDDLNLKVEKMEQLSVQEIKELYRPLIEQFQEITGEFKR